MNSARLLISFLIFVFSFFASSSTVLAQTEPKQNLHNYTQNVMIEVISALGCQVAGVDLVSPNQKCLGINNGKIGPVDSSGGAVGAMGSLIAATYTPPFGTGDYVGYLAGNFGITQPAYAEARDGLNQLSPLTNVWVEFRNITYLLLVLIFLIIGFAIMLRVRIDPRTVMSIENQIPKIIVGLVLVTFSFAIVGFLIDLMWVLIYLSMTVFNNIFVDIGVPALSENFRNFHAQNPLGVVNNLTLTGTDQGIFGITTNATSGVKTIVTSLFTGPGTVLDALSNIPLLGGLGDAIISTLVFIIIAIAILFSLFRLWFQLIKAYVMILIVAVFSPFWILAGLLPGSRLTFENLLRELGSNLITFPATLIMFLLAKTFIDVFAGPGAQNLFVPPFIGNIGAAGEGAKAIGALAGLGIILLTPDVNKMMRKALQAPEFDFSAIGRAVGVGAAYPISVGRQIGSIMMARGEGIINPQTQRYEELGTPRAFIRRVFGRG